MLSGTLKTCFIPVIASCCPLNCPSLRFVEAAVAVLTTKRGAVGLQSIVILTKPDNVFFKFVVLLSGGNWSGFLYCPLVPVPSSVEDTALTPPVLIRASAGKLPTAPYIPVEQTGWDCNPITTASSTKFICVPELIVSKVIIFNSLIGVSSS